MKQVITLFFCMFAAVTGGAQPDTLGWRLQHYKYPYPVKYMHTEAQDLPVEIAYMDEQPAHWNGKTVMLLHGKNFPAAYWARTIRALNNAGYRLIAPMRSGLASLPSPSYSILFPCLPCSINDYWTHCI